MTTINRQCNIQGKVRELHFTEHGHNIYVVRNGGKHSMRIRRVSFRAQEVRYRDGTKYTALEGTWVAEHMIQGRLASEGVVSVAKTAKRAFVTGCKYIWDESYVS